MEIDIVSPIVLDYAIQYLNHRPIGTKYHPRGNHFIIDCKMLSRILKHDGNLKAKTTKSENMFSAQILKYLIETEIIHSALWSGTYVIRSKDGLNYAIEVIKYNKLHSIFGKKVIKDGRPDDGDRNWKGTHIGKESLDGDGATTDR